MQNKNHKHKNNLLEFRRRANLEAKQIMFLLGKKSTDDLYRYENGNRYPNLSTVLKFAIILATPPHFLYQDLFQELKNEIDEKRNNHPHLFPQREWFPTNAEQLKQEEDCFYANILKSRIPTALELKAISKHALNIINTVGDYKQGRSPFSL